MHDGSRAASSYPRQAAGAGPFITAADLLDPRPADFTNPADVDVVEPVLQRICEEYDAYDASGSKAWDQTIDVAKRPSWMRALTGAQTPTKPDLSGLARVHVMPFPEGKQDQPEAEITG